MGVQDTVYLTDERDGTAMNLTTGEVLSTKGKPAAKAGAKPLPAGMVKQVGTSEGRPVYVDAKGKQHVG
jgi:hypothetical protein